MKVLKLRIAEVFLAIIFFLLFNTAFAQTKEASDLEFNSIKTLLKKDKLESEAQKKVAAAKRKKAYQAKLEERRYDYPDQEIFWGFMTEYFLVKNAPQLKWDFQKPDYGIWPSFRETLERVGFVNKKIKLIIVNTEQIYHMSLPGNDNEYYFLISLPFMKALDLSKAEISVLLLEDFIRLEDDLFKNKVSAKELNTIIGKNFYKKEPNLALIKKVLDNYYKNTFDQGFTFQEQFKTTKRMIRILSGHSDLLNFYKSTLMKIDNLVKANKSFKNYLKIYPSPEMQLEWLKPGKE